MINFGNFEKKHAPCFGDKKPIEFFFFFVTAYWGKKTKQVIWAPSVFNPFEIYCGALELLLNLKDCFEMK